MPAKYVIIIPDGAADEPLEIFNNQTAIEAAHTPNIDKISIDGRQGLVQTVPPDMSPGSDVAQMSLLGYDPKIYYTGRAPIESEAMGLNISDTDYIFRCNLITIADGNMADHSGGNVSNEESSELIKLVNKSLGKKNIKFYPGVSYRNITVFKDIDFDVTTCPPHDFIGKKIDEILPTGKNSELLIDLMARSQQLFANHDINKVRRDLGENQVSSIWLWGQGKRTVMDSFKKRFNLSGASITAVDLIRGLSKLIGFDCIKVEGATGLPNTNYKGKANAAIKALETHDIVFVHIEGPDEASHNGDAMAKKDAIEKIDKFIVGPVLEAIQKFPTWRIMVLPDHPTPVMTRGHSGDAVPFAMAGTGVTGILNTNYSEKNATKSGFKIEKGSDLMEYFLKI